MESDLEGVGRVGVRALARTKAVPVQTVVRKALASWYGERQGTPDSGERRLPNAGSDDGKARLHRSRPREGCVSPLGEEF